MENLPRMNIKHCMAGLVLSCLMFNNYGGDAGPALGSPDFRPSPEHPFGWRADGSGRFPAAEPPLTWGRQSKSIKTLRAQTGKPKSTETGNPTDDGVVHKWLTLGPIPIPAEKTDKDDYINEPTLQPDDGEKVGDLAWTPQTTETSYLDFWQLYGKTVPQEGKGFVAYAHTWLNSQDGKPLFLNIMITGPVKVWLNGKEVLTFGTKKDTLQYGKRIKLPMEKGWNRLLLRVARLDDTGWSKGAVKWHFNASLFGADPADGENTNIAWATPLPDNGPGVGSPILVGDKLFVPAETGQFICISAKDGHVLWARSTTCANAATPEERKANPEIFADIDKLTATVETALKNYCAAPEKYGAPEEKLAVNPMEAERKIMTLMRKVDKEKYPNALGSEGGDAAPTPVSDGQCVYALYSSGVVTCFDLEGNRKWTTVLDVRHAEHGYCASPCLIDGKVIVNTQKSLGSVILDGKTGAVVKTVPVFKNPGMYCAASPVPVSIGGEKYFMHSIGVLVRAKDGQVVANNFPPPYMTWSDFASPTFEGPLTCSNVIEQKDGNFRWAFQTLPAAGGEPFAMKDVKDCEYDIKQFPTWMRYDHCASPLLYQGLAYMVSVDGVLTVIDAATAKVVYQKLLDLSPMMNHGPPVIRAGCSSSPTLAGKHIYIWDDQGAAVVIEPGREFKQLAHNRIDRIYFQWGPSRNECFISCPIFSGKRMFMRGEAYLYCIEASK